MEDNTQSGLSEEDSALVDWYIDPQTVLHAKRRSFGKIVNLMEKYQEKINFIDFDFLEIMYKIMVSTQTDILSYNDDDKYFLSSSIGDLDFYITKSLKEFNDEILGKKNSLSSESKEKIGLSMCRACQAIDEFVRWHRTHEESSGEQTRSMTASEVRIKEPMFQMKINDAENLLSEIHLDDATMRKRIANLYKSAQKETRKMSRERVSAKKLLEDTKQFISEGAIQSEAKNFNETANGHMWRAWGSLIFAFSLGGLAILWGINLSSEKCEIENILRSFLCVFWGIDTRSFLFVAGMWGAGIFTLLRSYFANAQNEVSNRQRFNALQSYGILYRAAESPEDKNFIMKQAVECAYSHQPTGFVKPPKESTTLPRL